MDNIEAKKAGKQSSSALEQYQKQEIQSKKNTSEFMSSISLDDLELISRTIKIISIDMVERAKSGHPGAPMGLSEIATFLWLNLKISPSKPTWQNRDRFILSAGHASALLYSLLFLSGILDESDLMNFRQWGSRTPGHPELNREIGIEATTGPLGQGFAMGIGMAIAKKILAEEFNTPEFKIIDHFIYAIVSDGDLMEGVSQEATSLAGHLGLGELIYIYDSNRVTIDGPTNLTFSDDIALKFRSMGWHTVEIDGHDFKAISQALEEAKAEKNKPSLIIAHTIIGRGSPNKEGSNKTHGAPLGEDEVEAIKRKLGWELPQFKIPHRVKELFERKREDWENKREEWEKIFEAWRNKYPELAKKWDNFFSLRIPDIENNLPNYKAGAEIPTRNASEDTLQVICNTVQNLVGGSADLAESVKTVMKKYGFISKGNFRGRNIHFGVREHAMGGILNGIALYGGLIPFGGTFLVFSDYMRPAIRLSALMKTKVIFVFSHDSIFVGEDGPTHQPVEHLASLRAIPNLTVIRPADANEVPYAWDIALRENGPTAIILTRQPVKVIDRSKYAPASEIRKGGYVICKSEKPDVVIIATGSEVSLAIEVHEILSKKNIRSWVVNLASWEIFERQPEEYKKQVIPPGIPKVVIEAGTSFGWAKFAGEKAIYITVERFGESAPYKVIKEKFGFTPENISEKIEKFLKECK